MSKSEFFKTNRRVLSGRTRRKPIRTARKSLVHNRLLLFVSDRYRIRPHNFTRTHIHTHTFYIMALRQSLKQFTSKTTAFAPLAFAGCGSRMYSTVVEGLKYASSHEWYEFRAMCSLKNIFSLPLFFQFLSSLSLFLLRSEKRDV